MSGGKFKSLRDDTCDFVFRDFKKDVAALNRELCRNAARTAGFQSAPPSVITGDPFGLTPRKCIAVFGLNPKWQAGGLDGKWASSDVIPLLREHRDRDCRSYLARRANYFIDGDPQYYGRYFTPLGNCLKSSTLIAGAQDACDVFRRFAFKLDLLPWWSANVSSIDPLKLGPSTCEPLNAWKKLLFQFDVAPGI